MKYLLLLFLFLFPVYSFAQNAEDFSAELKLAQQGNRGAQNDVGIMYAEGQGVKKDNVAAVKWFQKSAEQGHVLGACNLAIHYGRAEGVRKNPVMALKWAFVSHSLDGLKCFPEDFLQFFKPTKAQVKRAWALADAFLRSQPQLKNEFGERPWLEKSSQPN